MPNYYHWLYPLLPLADGCNQDITDDSGSIIPPDTYKPNTTCTYVFHYDDSTHIYMYLAHAQLGADDATMTFYNGTPADNGVIYAFTGKLGKLETLALYIKFMELVGQLLTFVWIFEYFDYTTMYVDFDTLAHINILDCLFIDNAF